MLKRKGDALGPAMSKREYHSGYDGDYDRKLAELDRLLNDPDVPMEAARVWSLLAEISPQPAASGD